MARYECRACSYATTGQLLAWEHEIETGHAVTEDIDPEQEG